MRIQQSKTIKIFVATVATFALNTGDDDADGDDDDDENDDDERADGFLR